MADSKITELLELGAGGLAANDVYAVADVSASATKKITIKNLIEDGVTFIDDGAIPITKVDTTTLTYDLADRAVTASKLDDQSSGYVMTPLINGMRIGQVGLDTADNKFYVWSGSTWVEVKAAGSVNSIVADNGSDLAVTVIQTDDEVTITVDFRETTAAAQFLAGPTNAAGEVTARAIVGDDLPTASATEKGAVKVSGGGLAMNGDVIEIDNTIGASNGTYNIVDVNEKGLVVGYRQIEANDIPIATDSTPGAVKPGVDLAVDGTGTLNHISKGTPGTYTKVTVDSTGHVTLGASLDASDIPVVDGGAISGPIDADVNIADRSIEEIKLADYSTCQMQEANPGSGYKLGHFWWQPSTAQLRIYSRGSGPENVWRPVGFGALQANNLRWGGIIDANLSTIVTVTSIGASENLTAGQQIPPPSDTLSGMYFITQVEGNSINQPNVGGTTFTPGDWLLCINATEGYIHIDAGAAGGGGGNVNYLNDLLDVEIGPLQQGPFGIPTIDLADGQMLMYDGDSGMWRNYDVIDGGIY